MSNKFYIINGISGIWNSYGCPVQKGEGLSLHVEDTNDGSESLIDLVNFDRTPKDIGMLRDSKNISELVVMLPMLQDKLDYIEPPDWIEPPVYKKEDPCAPCEEKTQQCEDNSYTSIRDYIDNIKNPLDGLMDVDLVGTWYNNETDSSNVVSTSAKKIIAARDLLKFSVVENAWLFTINEEIINKILDVIDYKVLPIKQIKEILDTKKDLNLNNNIVKLMKCMVKYNFPPHLNWLVFPDKVPPYAMYVAEFSATLDKHDLSNIWQGTMPNIAQEPQEEEITIEHFLSEEEIFGGFNIANIENIKLSIFKCKLRANNNYYDLLKRTNWRGNPELEGRSEWYQYNWPYDNFSLVELLKIEAGEIRQFVKPEDVAESVIIKSDGSKEYNINKEDIKNYNDDSRPYEPSLYE